MTTTPTFLYQDTNAVVVLAYQDDTGLAHSNLLPTRRELLERWAAEQIERSRRATGVFAMSQWYADFLVSRQGVSPERIMVAPAGLNNPPTAYRNPSQAPTGRLLFVGTDFLAKGGDLVVEATRRLHRNGDRPVRLTVVGPKKWPLRGDVPEFVEFAGRMAPAQVATIYAKHDILAMPSRFEGFGIALAEALVAGLPCVGRRAFAMPEIVHDGVTGALIASDDPDELAHTLYGLLDDNGVYARVAAARPALLARHDWNAVGASMAGRMEEVAGSEP